MCECRQDPYKVPLLENMPVLEQRHLQAALRDMRPVMASRSIPARIQRQAQMCAAQPPSPADQLLAVMSQLAHLQQQEQQQPQRPDQHLSQQPQGQQQQQDGPPGSRAQDAGSSSSDGSAVPARESDSEPGYAILSTSEKPESKASQGNKQGDGRAFKGGKDASGADLPNGQGQGKGASSVSQTGQPGGRGPSLSTRKGSRMPDHLEN